MIGGTRSIGAGIQRVEATIQAGREQQDANRAARELINEVRAGNAVQEAGVAGQREATGLLRGILESGRNLSEAVSNFTVFDG